MFQIFDVERVGEEWRILLNNRSRNEACYLTLGEAGRLVPAGLLRSLVIYRVRRYQNLSYKEIRHLERALYHIDRNNQV